MIDNQKRSRFQDRYKYLRAQVARYKVRWIISHEHREQCGCSQNELNTNFLNKLKSIKYVARNTIKRKTDQDI